MEFFSASKGHLGYKDNVCGNECLTSELHSFRALRFIPNSDEFSSTKNLLNNKKDLTYGWRPNWVCKFESQILDFEFSKKLNDGF